MGLRIVFVCSVMFFQVLFSQNSIFAGWGHFEEVQLKGDLSDFSQIWSVEKIKIFPKKACWGIISLRVISVRSLRNFL
jgi:hypothetical protein